MKKTTPILAILFVLIAGFFLWTIISKDPAASSSSPLSSQTVQTESLTDAKTLETLANMRNIKLDARIFDDPAFQALISTDREIVKEPVGRANPFSPVGSDAAVINEQDQTGDTTPSQPPVRTRNPQ